MPNIFTFVADDQFMTEDLILLSNLVDNQSENDFEEEEDFYLFEENDRKKRVFDYPSETLNTIILGRKKKSETIKSTNVRAIAQGVRNNKKLSENKKASKIRIITSDPNDTESYRANVVYEGTVYNDASNNSSFKDPDVINSNEELNEVMQDYAFLKEKFLSVYGVDLGVLLTNAFKGEEVAIKTLVKLKDEHEDLSEVMDDLLSLYRDNNIEFDLFNMKGGF